jgi:outer membrane protein assembly factor BamB
MLVLTADPVSLPSGSTFDKMLIRTFMMLAACILCGADAVGAQRQPEEAYVPLKKCWEYIVDGPERPTVSVAGAAVYITETEGRVRALDIVTGSVKWVTDLGGRVVALQAVPEKGVAVVTASISAGRRPTLRLLNADSGLVMYSVGIDAGNDVQLVSNSYRIIAFDPNGTVIALNLQNGASNWRIELRGRVTAPPAISADGNLVIATQDKKVTVLSPTGSVAGSFFTERQITSLAIRDNGMIIAGDDRGNVTNYRDLTGTPWWKFKSGARVGNITETSEGILVGSFDNFLYMVSKYTGDVRWKRRLEGRIVSGPAIIGKRLIAASSAVETAQVIDLETGKPIDQIAFAENRFLLAKPFVGRENTAVFTLVDGVAAFAPNGCGHQIEKGG